MIHIYYGNGKGKTRIFSVFEERKLLRNRCT